MGVTWPGGRVSVLATRPRVEATMGPDEKTGVGTALEAATVLVMGPEAVMISKLVEVSIGAARAA